MTENKRTWRPKMANPVDPLDDYSTYQSYQKTINSNNGQINEDLLEEHIEMIMKDPKYVWEEIEVDFSDLKKGDRIRYVTLTPKGERMFRTGGWVTAIGDDKDWLSYMAHTKTSWCLQEEDCQRLFVTRAKEKPKKSDILVFNIPAPKTKFSAYLKDVNGDLQRVGSFKDNWLLARFTNTIKFEKAKSGHPWKFKDA